MNTNIIIIDFVKNNFLAILFFILLLTKIIPPEWAGFWKYKNDRVEDGPAQKITILRLIFNNLVDSLWSTVVINLTVFLRDTIISFIIFGSLGFDIFIRHQISKESITLVCIGVIVLYLEMLIKTGKSLKLFGTFLVWEREDQVASLATKDLK